MIFTIIKESRFAFLTAIITAFARVIGETGMTLMVGGNIKGTTMELTINIIYNGFSYSSFYLLGCKSDSIRTS